MVRALKEPYFLSEDEYLHHELKNDLKHEYVNGEAIAMSGASVNHGRISGNIFRKFGNHLEKKTCEPFMSDMKVKTSAGNYRYPDVMVVCDNDFIHNGYVTQTPVILVEVLSPSTRRIDEKIKLLEYTNISSLKEYVLIEQSCADITLYRKSDEWRSTHYFLGEDIYFESINLTVSVEDIYHRVDNDDVLSFFKEKIL